jgi:hypothetical protein
MDQTYHIPDFFFNPVFIGVCIVLGIIQIAAQWRIFQKAGRPGWEILIPIYNAIILLRIIGKPWWWLLLMCIPLVNIIYIVWMINMLSKSFGKDEGFTAGLIFLGVVFYPILGFGNAKYQGPYGDAKAFAEYQGKNKFDFEQPR